MDNRLSLQEYLSVFKTVYEKRQVFYAVFQEMHRLHKNGEYLTQLSFQTVSVCYTNPMDIRFSHYSKIGFRPIQEVLNVKFQNIVVLSQMMVAAFLENGLQQIICVEVLKEQLSSLKKFFAPEDYSFLEKVFLQDECIYYDDYIKEITGEDYPFLSGKESSREEAFTNYLFLIVNVSIIATLFAWFLILFLH